MKSYLQDGQSGSAVLVSAFLMFVGFVSKPQDAAQMFAVRRAPPSFQSSEIRLILNFQLYKVRRELEFSVFKEPFFFLFLGI